MILSMIIPLEMQHGAKGDMLDRQAACGISMAGL